MSNKFEPMPIADVAVFFDCSSDKFGELAVLFDAIANRHDEFDATHKLAILGKEVALDYENMCDCWMEQVEKGGVRHE